MDNMPISGLEDLEKHLHELLETPETPLNAKLFDDVELQLTVANTPPVIPRLLPSLTQILPICQQDPSIIVSLAIKLLKPVTFTQIMTMTTEESLVLALQSPAPSANILAMTVMEKAAASPTDVTILSIMKNEIVAFVTTWLSSPSVEVGEKASRTLGDLLEVDCDQLSNATLNATLNGQSVSIRPQSGQGLLWRRIFHDRDVYALILSLCSPTTIGSGPGRLDARQKSLAQARLLRILPRLATLDFASIARPRFPDIDASYGLPDGLQGLLFFASLYMVDVQDYVMHITLIHFFREFLETISMTDISPQNMDTLQILMKEAAAKDDATEASLLAIQQSSSVSPELKDLLLKLQAYREEDEICFTKNCIYF